MYKLRRYSKRRARVAKNCGKCGAEVKKGLECYQCEKRFHRGCEGVRSGKRLYKWVCNKCL